MITGRQEILGLAEGLCLPAASMVERNLVETGFLGCLVAVGGPGEVKPSLAKVSVASGKVEGELDVGVAAVLDVSPTRACAGEDNPVEIPPNAVGLLVLAEDSSAGAAASVTSVAAAVGFSVER